MADPVPQRGIATVSQVEALLRPASRYNDFRYHHDTQPTIQEVCNYIDYAYDKLLPILISYGIVIPIPEGATKRFCAYLNALQAAIDIETSIHSSSPPKSTTKLEKLKLELTNLLDMFKSGVVLPSTGDSGEPATNSRRPLFNMSDVLWSSNVDLPVKDPNDSASKLEFIFRMDDEF